MSSGAEPRTIRIWESILICALLVLFALGLLIGLPVATALYGGPERLLNLAFLLWIGFMAWAGRATPLGYDLTAEAVTFRTPTGPIEINLKDVDAIELPWYSSWGTLQHANGSISLAAGMSLRVYRPLIQAVRAANPSVKVRGRWTRKA